MSVERHLGDPIHSNDPVATVTLLEGGPEVVSIDSVRYRVGQTATVDSGTLEGLKASGKFDLFDCYRIDTCEKITLETKAVVKEATPPEKTKDKA